MASGSSKPSKTSWARQHCQPAMPIPGPPMTVERRIETLQWAIDTARHEWEIAQIDNIKAAIELYRQDAIKLGDEVFVMDGKLVSREERAQRPGELCWIEVRTSMRSAVCVSNEL